MEYFTIVRPQSVTAEGLFKDLESGLRELGISEISAELCSATIEEFYVDSLVNLLC